MTTNTYELQVYQNGGWQFDSYYDNKDLVLSEAERIDSGGRYLGVRVLVEKFNEERQSSSFATIFSRLKKNDEIGEPASQGARTGAAASNAGDKSSGSARTGARTGARKSKKKGSNVTWILMGGISLVVLGIGMILALREFSGSI